MRHRHELTDEQWERLAPLLPRQKPRTGRPGEDHRRILNGMLWIHATGAPWRDLPERYGPWQTVATRFYRWVHAGLWQRLLAALQRQGDAAGKLDWSQHYVDGTVIRAHQHAAGARRAKGGPRSKRSGGAGAGSVPSSTCAPRAAASRSPFW
jgi:transposase